jgi:hypothetical protein
MSTLVMVLRTVSLLAFSALIDGSLFSSARSLTGHLRIGMAVNDAPAVGLAPEDHGSA